MRHLCTYITKCSISVSIHAPTRGATGTYIVSYKVSCVSIHAPTRGATITSVNTYARTFWFQSTHPRGVRPLLVVLPGYLTRFQSTHPRGVRLSRCTVKQSLGISFNPRTHEGCDFVKLLAQCVPRCFNPRTHEGCDHGWHHRRRFYNLFQSTHPRGVRRLAQSFRLAQHAVSIHAPTRGATWRKVFGLLNMQFQSTHPRGVRLDKTCHVSLQVLLFQSTHPRGVRQCINAISTESIVFQSTHPRGVRHKQT